MAFEINSQTTGQIQPIAETQFLKLDLALYLGQSIQATVVSPPNNRGEVTVNINGQNIQAKTNQSFTPGETLNVKVTNSKDELVLQVQQQNTTAPVLQKTVLQNALMQNLPKQAAPNNLMDSLKQVLQTDQNAQASNKLSPTIMQQIKTLLDTIPSLSQLPQQLPKAVSQSGVFLESTLLQAPSNLPQASLQSDFKAQCLQLLNKLPITLNNTEVINHSAPNTNTPVTRDSLPLPGAFPQPLHKDTAAVNLTDKSPETIQHIIHDQISQALSRITLNQVTHLSQAPNEQHAPIDNQNGFLIMMDIPVKTSQNNIDVIPLMIKQRQATPTEPEQWSMSFAVSLSQLGDMQGTVSLSGNKVNVKINADNPDTIPVLQEQQTQMESLLHEMGLHLGTLSIQQGLENNQIPTANLNLLDIRI